MSNAGYWCVSVFTDLSGRYRIAGLAPGNYRVRATAVTFLPATRWNLRLATGMRDLDRRIQPRPANRIRPNRRHQNSHANAAAFIGDPSFSREAVDRAGWRP